MAQACYPSFYQINTHTWLTELSRKLGCIATLDDIPDVVLDRMAEIGVDWLWFLSVWQTGLAGQRMSRSHPEWRREFQERLPDLCEEDIAGSGFAITDYTVHQAMGGEAALDRLRVRLQEWGLGKSFDSDKTEPALQHALERGVADDLWSCDRRRIAAIDSRLTMWGNPSRSRLPLLAAPCAQG